MRVTRVCQGTQPVLSPTWGQWTVQPAGPPTDSPGRTGHSPRHIVLVSQSPVPAALFQRVFRPHPPTSPRCDRGSSGHYVAFDARALDAEAFDAVTRVSGFEPSDSLPLHNPHQSV